MADFEPDQDSVSRAEGLSAQLLRDLRQFSEEGFRRRGESELFTEHRYRDQAEGVPIEDVLHNLGRMAGEFSLVRHRGLGAVPCLRLEDGELAPLSMDQFGGSGHWSSPDWYHLAGYYDYVLMPQYEQLEELSKEEREDITFEGVEAAEGAVGRNLFSFLSFRFAGMKEWTNWARETEGGPNSPSSHQSRSANSSVSPPIAPGGGLQIKVSCRTPGLRIHISPAYFVTWTYFGSPTSPVTSYVLPGRYIFAGDGPMLPRKRRDNGVFSIPPTYQPSLMRF